MDTFKLRCAVAEFCREFRIKVFFQGTENPPTESGYPILRNRSSFNPPVLLAFEAAVIKDIEALNPNKKHFQNLTTAEK